MKTWRSGWADGNDITYAITPPFCHSLLSNVWRDPNCDRQKNGLSERLRTCDVDAPLVSATLGAP